MNPALIQLFPTVMQLLEEASKTEAGKKYLDKGKKIVEVSLPYIKDASDLVIEFLSTDVGKELFGDVKGIKLSKKLDVVDRGLSLSSSYDKNQSVSIKQSITEGFEIVKGQNEIHFLSNSIKYFIDCHRYRVGIDVNISHALQYDINAVLRYLEKRNDIRFPGYLLHQLQSLSKTVSELNVFYDSIYKDGYVSDYTEENLLSELNETSGVDREGNEDVGYYPCEMILKAEKARLEKISSLQVKKSPGGRLFNRSSDMPGGVCDALDILKKELVYNEKLGKKIINKLKITPGNKILVESF